jgi:hypothetical protein
MSTLDETVERIAGLTSPKAARAQEAGAALEDCWAHPWGAGRLEAPARTKAFADWARTYGRDLLALATPAQPPEPVRPDAGEVERRLDTVERIARARVCSDPERSAVLRDILASLSEVHAALTGGPHAER